MLSELSRYLSWRLGLLAVCVLVFSLTGCDSDPYRLGKTAEVKGRVTIGDRPLHTGIVTFIPDASQGNTTAQQPSANIDENGNYALFTVGKAAAPLGWYKVVVTAYEKDADIEKRAKSPGETGRIAKNLVDRKYEEPKTTPLSLEVVENPASGAYDLKLSR